MLARYVEVTGDTSILTRAIPLAEVETLIYVRYLFTITNSTERAQMVGR